MRCPSETEDEAGRLRALSEYGLTAERGLPSLDPIVDMAAQIFDCPSAAVNMIGDDHVFLVSTYGIDDYDARRDVSFCAHAINQTGVMVVEDAALDPRFHDNPLVTGGYVRFYAGVPIRDPSGQALGALCVMDTKPHAQFDKDDRKRLTEMARLASDRMELRRIEVASEVGASRLEASAATSPNAIICFNADARITALNKAAEVMFGRSSQDVIGASVDLLVAEQDVGLVYAGIARVLGGGEPSTAGTELVGVRSSGERFPGELHWSRWLESDGMHFGAIIRDMTEQRREHDALYHLANFDTLTGLANRNQLDRRITEILAAGRVLALIVTDLEGFSDINNTLGHAAGDRVLREVSRRIRGQAPPEALVARIGGDEFAMLLPDHGDPVALSECARAIISTLAEPIIVDGHELRISGSCGMAIAPGHGGNAQELMGSANLALFHARSGGPGGSFIFVPSLRAEAVARRMYDAELHRAFERGEFELFYQPQINLADGSLAGAEALIRWQHPARGLLAPAAFLPALENGVLADPVGRWVIESACAQAADWRRIDPTLTVGINLFAAQFRSGDLPRIAMDLLAKHGLPSHAIEMEITENIILDQQEKVLEQVQQLREAGFMLAFDDFGTGYASLNLLRSFPVTHIKIDRGFTNAMASSDKDRAIVLSLIDLAGELGLQVIAEGVETQEDCNFLRRHGCQRGQGYFFGRPIPAAVFEEIFLTDGRAQTA